TSEGFVLTRRYVVFIPGWAGMNDSGFMLVGLLTSTISTPKTMGFTRMPKSRGRKPKKKRAPASAPKKGLDDSKTAPHEPPLSAHPPREPPLATTRHQEQPTPKKQFAKLITAVVLAAIAIVLCAYAFILTKQ